MNKKRRILAATLAISSVLACSLLFVMYSSEPRYKGKTLTDWLAAPNAASTQATSSTRDTNTLVQWVRAQTKATELEGNPELREMLSELGSNAVPVLVKHLGVGTTLRARTLRKIAASTSIPGTFSSMAASNLLMPMFLVYRSYAALRFLGTNATCAIPELEELAGSNERHWGQSAAFNLLTGLGPEGWEAIHRVLTNAPPMARSNFQFTAQSAISQLLMRGELRQREEAALALCHLDSPPFNAIPVLASIISSSETARQIQALHGLAKLAPDYVTARDAIKQAAKSDHPEVRSLARSILDSTNQFNTAAKR